MRNGLFGINKGGYLWEQHKFTSERWAHNKYIELVFCVLKKFPWAKLHSNLTVGLHWLNCISSLMLVLMFIGDIVEMDRDEAFTHSLSQLCTRHLLRQGLLIPRIRLLKHLQMFALKDDLKHLEIIVYYIETHVRV